MCLCSRLCGYHSPLHLLISWCVVVILSKGDLFETSSDWMHSIVTYWQVKYKKRVGKSVLLETFLWSEKKVASHLCRRWIILREWRVGGRREGGKCFRWQGSISEPGRPRCYAPPGSCQSPRQSPITISVICNLRGLGNLQFEGTEKSAIWGDLEIFPKQFFRCFDVQPIDTSRLLRWNVIHAKSVGQLIASLKKPISKERFALTCRWMSTLTCQSN